MKPYFIFETGFFALNIPSYSLFGCIGVYFMSLLIYNRITRVDQMTFFRYLILIGTLIGGAAIGSKLLFIITIIPKIIKNFSVQYAVDAIITAGFVFYGGLFGAVGALYIYTRVFRYSFLELSNVCAPAFPLFHIFGRLGCLFAGCCYGKEMVRGFYHLADQPGVARIPVQLFESTLLIVLTIMILTIEKRISQTTALMKIYITAYALCRFFLEFMRGDIERGVWFGLSTSQWISIFIILGMAAIHQKRDSGIIRGCSKTE